MDDDMSGLTSGKAPLPYEIRDTEEWLRSAPKIAVWGLCGWFVLTISLMCFGLCSSSESARGIAVLNLLSMLTPLFLCVIEYFRRLSMLALAQRREIEELKTRLAELEKADENEPYPVVAEGRQE